MVGYKVGALFGGGLLAWLSVYCSWEWLFTLWGFFYIAILIVVLLNKNTESCTKHNKRQEVTYRDRIKENIDHFTVVSLVTWPLHGSEAEGDLALIQTSLLLLCKCT